MRLDVNKYSEFVCPCKKAGYCQNRELSFDTSTKRKRVIHGVLFTRLRFVLVFDSFPINVNSHS
ncbi:hypothetical protein Pla52n_41430 [Stieleria varia]|uniref:Uncharacterized protein n=1 Tax=Stieleria varia TaxID=2528005 RepID=A0A5C6ARJ9_9BACT|nr:hypothetical protein Pla52n_41430 [Stieleria varia]